MHEAIRPAPPRPAPACRADRAVVRELADMKVILRSGRCLAIIENTLDEGLGKSSRATP
jgi:hypothetical protein